MPPAAVPLRPSSIIDISHESLMRIWKRLIQWVDEEARSAQIYLRISKAAAQFQEGKAGLFRDPELQLALNWRDETKPNAIWAERYDVAFERAMVFLEHSEKQRDLETEEKERQRRRQLQWARRLAIILGSGGADHAGVRSLRDDRTDRGRWRTSRRRSGRRRSPRSSARRPRRSARWPRPRRSGPSRRGRRRKSRGGWPRSSDCGPSSRSRRPCASAGRRRRPWSSRRRLERTRRRSDCDAVDEKERADEMRVQAETSESEAQRLQGALGGAGARHPDLPPRPGGSARAGRPAGGAGVPAAREKRRRSRRSRSLRGPALRSDPGGPGRADGFSATIRTPSARSPPPRIRPWSPREATTAPSASLDLGAGRGRAGAPGLGGEPRSDRSSGSAAARVSGRERSTARPDLERVDPRTPSARSSTPTRAG